MGHISELLDEVLAIIINRLTYSWDRDALSEVSKQLLKARRWCRSSIRYYRELPNRRLLSQCPNVVEFASSGALSDEDLSFVAQACPKLEILDLRLSAANAMVPPNRRSLLNGILSVAHGCPKLVQPGGMIRDADIQVLSRITSLAHLDLRHCFYVTDMALCYLNGMALHYLDLSACAISDIGIEILVKGSSSRTMKTLILQGCSRITDRGILMLHNLSNLEELNLGIHDAAHYALLDGLIFDDVSLSD
ncbi:uncharacterized protein LOC133729517 [Rosa rugosa]|uniref:uncharacterized protein LOC133729517 n=1 Tax=Rosa rugosa TaxID=74645 RepID=UPI002B404516|nr:uncharacterized protein LOC133729517 [Rosa rugosa]